MQRVRFDLEDGFKEELFKPNYDILYTINRFQIDEYLEYYRNIEYIIASLTSLKIQTNLKIINTVLRCL